MPSSFTPYESLRNRTFVGLIISQFLAAFNDQAIHAAAMFYAIRSDTLTEAQAISLMPILFYLPWAIFCTLAGHFADRYSKKYSLIFWKIAEVGITLIALGGFWLGTQENKAVGPWIVLGTVFLMGMHSAFFVPAKYGVMPEILHPNLLSKANGVLEGTSFLAVIMGTVAGGVLSDVFQKEEQYIGVVLVVLAIIGMIVSFRIQWMPPANPTRPFPWNLFKPLAANLRTLLRSRPLALAVLGIAFFTFMVAFMRGTVYMHGESHHWREFKTSLVVGTVGLGTGIGTYLAGMLSGHKVELGLVPLGAIGMILATLAAGMAVFWLPGLVIAIVLIGFFSGFYIVPLYTLLQQRAPKASKGDLIATSNFLNVTGAITASLFFFGLAVAARSAGIATPIEQTPLAQGTLQEIHLDDGRPVSFKIKQADGQEFGKNFSKDHKDNNLLEEPAGAVIMVKKASVFDRLQVGEEVAVSRYELGGRTVYQLRPVELPLTPAYDQERVPRYLFIAASLMTLGILILLCRKLPDFFVRSLLWLRSYGRYHIRVYGLNHLPTEGPAILATNCHRFNDSMHVLACTDRTVRFILSEEKHDEERQPFLRFLARRTGMIVLPAGATTGPERDKAVQAGLDSLRWGDVVALSDDVETPAVDFEFILNGLRSKNAAPIIPVFCGMLAVDEEVQAAVKPKALKRIRVVLGEALPADASADAVRAAIEQLARLVYTKDLAPTSSFSVVVPTSSSSTMAAPADGSSSPA